MFMLRQIMLPFSMCENITVAWPAWWPPRTCILARRMRMHASA